MQNTVEARAVKIAARIMVAAGLCQYDDPAKCRKEHTDKSVCDKCIETWLITKARKEMEEGRYDG